MEMLFEQPVKFPFIVNQEVRYPLVVCSHERSGTHFLMNSIAANTSYVAKPWLNFDLYPLGSFINFYSQGGVSKFLHDIGSIKSGDGMNTLASIIKSHHESDFFTQSFANRNLRFIYIYRNPADTLISLWRFMHRWNWHEGMVAETPLEFASCAPEGQMMRYQYGSYASYFDRWASHVSGWKRACEENDNIMLVQYESLKNHYSEEMKKISGFLQMEPAQGDFRQPDREEYIKGNEITLSEDDKGRVIAFINEHLEGYPEIKNMLSL